MLRIYLKRCSQWLSFCFPHHDQVDQGHCIEADAPQPHDPKHVDQDHGDGDADEHGWPQLEAQKHCRHHKYGRQGHTQIQSCVIRNCEVLLVKHVENAVKGQMFILVPNP